MPPISTFNCSSASFRSDNSAANIDAPLTPCNFPMRKTTNFCHTLAIFSEVAITALPVNRLMELGSRGWRFDTRNHTHQVKVSQKQDYARWRTDSMAACA